MAQSARNLQLVNKETGEITSEACPGCFKRDEQIATLKVEKRGWSTRYFNLKRATEAEHEGHDLFPAAVRLFDYYKQLCRHPHHKPSKTPKCPACERTMFTVDRFHEVKPRLQEHDEEMCRLAIQGAAFDPFVTRRKNGTVKHHNDWHQIFAADKFMEFCNKAPVHLPDPYKVQTLTQALIFLYPQLDSGEAVEAAQRMLRQ